MGKSRRVARAEAQTLRTVHRNKGQTSKKTSWAKEEKPRDFTKPEKQRSLDITEIGT